MAADAHTVPMVDDDAEIREMLSEYFAQRGHVILEATDGLEAALMMKRTGQP